MLKKFQEQLPDKNSRLKLDNAFQIKKADNKTSEIKIQVNNIETLISNMLYSYVYMFARTSNAPVILNENKLPK